MRKTKKTPNAKDWKNRAIETWNVTTFTEYLKANHKELYGIDYAPFGGSYGMEQGILGDLIGTQSRKNPKKRTAEPADVKRFIDETFANYKPTAQYPGTSFGFMWTYRKTDWQRIQAERLRHEERKQAEKEAPSLDDLAGWL